QRDALACFVAGSAPANPTCFTADQLKACNDTAPNGPDGELACCCRPTRRRQQQHIHHMHEWAWCVSGHRLRSCRSADELRQRVDAPCTAPEATSLLS